MLGDLFSSDRPAAPLLRCFPTVKSACLTQAASSSPPLGFSRQGGIMSAESRELKDRISTFSDEELLMITEVNSTDYRKEAIYYATEELTRRGIPITTGVRMLSTLEVEPKYKGVKGLLLFCCLDLAIFYPLYLIIGLVNGITYINAHPDQFPYTASTIIFTVLIGVSFICYSIYTGSALWTVKLGAVKIATTYLMVLFTYSIINGLGNLVLAVPVILPDFTRAITAFMWYLYLNDSERVKATYTSIVSEYRGVRGWLLFFCLNLIIIYPFIFLQAIVRTALAYTAFPHFLSTSWLMTNIIVDIIYIGMALFSVYAGIALWKTRPNAVKMAKVYLVVFFVFYVAVGFLILKMDLQQSKEIFTLVYGWSLWLAHLVAWYVYLNKSKRVKATYVQAPAVLGEQATITP
jgi:uncharacterized protein DUF2569